MESLEKEKILSLYPEFDNVYGPYLRKDGRNTVVLYKDGKTSSRQLAKVRLETILGRRLLAGETVDHKDENCGNDDPSNLQLLSHSDNAAKTYRVTRDFVRIDNDQTCIVCGAVFRNKKER